MPNVHDHVLTGLEVQRSKLQEELSAVGDFRRGNVNVVFRRCGKPGCSCAEPNHPGHGPLNTLTKSVAGKTVTRAVAPGPELAKVQKEVAAYKRFKTVVEDIVEVNEQICEARPLSDVVPAAAVTDGKKGGPRDGTPRRNRAGGRTARHTPDPRR